MSLPSIIFHTHHFPNVDRFIPFARRENNPDIIEINADGEGISVEMIREIKQILIEKPYYESHRVVILYQADTMNLSSQNALLKSLEEPPSYIQLILVTETPSVLLETIRSRCLLIIDDELSPTDNSTAFPKYHELLSTEQGTAMELGEQFKERGSASGYVLELLNQAKDTLNTKADLKTLADLQHLQEAYLMLHANTNVKLAMQWLLLKLSSK